MIKDLADDSTRGMRVMTRVKNEGIKNDTLLVFHSTVKMM